MSEATTAGSSTVMRVGGAFADAVLEVVGAT
jgi:hypothetical protein